MEKRSVFFDHIEVHVKNVPAYCKFLSVMFNGGRYKVISDSGTSMFVSDDGINIEVKKKATKVRRAKLFYLRDLTGKEAVRA